MMAHRGREVLKPASRIHTHCIEGSVLLGGMTGADKGENRVIDRNPLCSEKRRGGPRQAVLKPAIKSGIDAKAI